MTENPYSPSICKCFLFYCLNLLLAQFNKLHPGTLKNSTPEDQTEGKNDKSLNPRSIGRKKIETPRHKNHLKTRLHEPSTLLGFPDQAKIFQHPRFLTYHSIPLEEVA